MSILLEQHIEFCNPVYECKNTILQKYPLVKKYDGSLFVQLEKNASENIKLIIDQDKMVLYSRSNYANSSKSFWSITFSKDMLHIVYSEFKKNNAYSNNTTEKCLISISQDKGLSATRQFESLGKKTIDEVMNEDDREAMLGALVLKIKAIMSKVDFVQENTKLRQTAIHAFLKPMHTPPPLVDMINNYVISG